MMEATSVNNPSFMGYQGRFVGRSATRDEMMTYRSAQRTHDQNNNSMGVNLGNRFTTHDGRTVDSTGAFLVGELERLDLTLHEPLAAVSWGRDIDLREDVTIADEVSSFTLSTYASAGGLGVGNSIGNGKAWIGKSTSQITGIGVDIAKIPNPLALWGMEIKYTIPELESSAKLGRPIDQQKYEGLQLKHQMDVDEQVYIGDTTTGATGLLNSSLVTNAANIANGGSGSPLWASKSPDDILLDFNEVLNSAWAATGYSIVPSRVLLPPQAFGQISMQKVSTAGNVSVLKYVQENNLLTTSGRGKLEIYPCKWNVGAGAGGTVGTANGHDRMLVYTKDKQRVRFPMTLLQRTPIQYVSIYHMTTYFCRLGVVEVVYPQCIAYRDGLS